MEKRANECLDYILKLGNKFCNKCEKTKLLKDYCRNKNTKNGYEAYCIECKRKYLKNWRDKNRTEVRKNANRLAERYKKRRKVKSYIRYVMAKHEIGG